MRRIRWGGRRLKREEYETDIISLRTILKKEKPGKEVRERRDSNKGIDPFIKEMSQVLLEVKLGRTRFTRTDGISIHH